MLPLGSVAATGSSTAKAETLTSQQMAALRFVRHRVAVYQHNSCHWRELMDKPCARSSNSVKRTRSVAYALWVLDRWKGLAKRDHDGGRHWMVKQTKRFRTETSTMRSVMGQPMAGSTRQLASAGSIEARFNHARREYKAVLQQWQNPPHERELLCIHSGEGAWDANTGNGYYGGLQMDVPFQSHYGAYLLHTKGTADNWTPLEQMHAAENAIRTRGFSPWPNTAAACGLL